MKKYLIAIYGTHATGKSNTVAMLQQILGQKYIWTLGAYKKRDGRNFYTGGSDTLSKYTSDEKREMVKEMWTSDIPLLMVEGYMTSSGHMYTRWYDKLSKEYPERKLLLIYFFTQLQEMIKRINDRGKRKMDQNRMEKMRRKCEGSKRSLKNAKKEFPHMTIWEYDTTNPKTFNKVISDIIDLVCVV